MSQSFLDWIKPSRIPILVAGCILFAFIITLCIGCSYNKTVDSTTIITSEQVLVYDTNNVNIPNTNYTCTKPILNTFYKGIYCDIDDIKLREDIQ